jgi:uncharacterized OsmC-like protein
MEVQTKINGVNTEQLLQTMDAISENPGIARFEFRNVNQWIDGSWNRSSVQGFYGAGQEDTSRTEPFVWDNDEPPVLLGENRGGNPVEYVLHALAGCITTTLVLHAASKGVPIMGIRTTFKGQVDVQGLLGMSKKVRPGYQHIQVHIEVDSDAPRKTIEGLVELAKRRSPVFDTISNPVQINVQLK